MATGETRIGLFGDPRTTIHAGVLAAHLRFLDEPSGKFAAVKVSDQRSERHA